MKINLHYGIDKLLFGMKQNDVTAVYGKPDKNFKDEDGNTILVYNKHKLRLTFYEDEDLRLGFIVASSPELELNSCKIIGRAITDVKKDLEAHKMNKFTEETIDTFTNYFNEDNWLILQTEFDEVVKLELGAIFKNEDEFDWKFGK